MTAALRHAINVTMVNTPFQVQHHPWLAFHHGAFSNASIVLHELKNPNSSGWTFAPQRGSGPFVPYHRQCGQCEAMGWSTIPGNPLGRWRCCGAIYLQGGSKIPHPVHDWASHRMEHVCPPETGMAIFGGANNR